MCSMNDIKLFLAMLFFALLLTLPALALGAPQENPMPPDKVQTYAALSPMQKARILRMLKQISNQQKTETSSPLPNSSFPNDGFMPSAATEEPITVGSVFDLDFNYVTDKNAATLVFDDGDRTYIRIPEKLLNRPHELRVIGVHTDGEEVRQFTFQQDFVVVEGIFDHIKLHYKNTAYRVFYKRDG